MSKVFLIAERYGRKDKGTVLGLLPRNALLTKIGYYYFASQNGMSLNDEENNLLKWAISEANPIMTEYIRKLSTYKCENGYVSSSSSVEAGAIPIPYRNRSYKQVTSAQELMKIETPADCTEYLTATAWRTHREFMEVMASQERSGQKMNIIRSAMRLIKRNQYGLLSAFRFGYYALARSHENFKHLSHIFYNQEALYRMIRDKSSLVSRTNLKRMVMDYDESILAIIVDACSASYHQYICKKYPEGMPHEAKGREYNLLGQSNLNEQIVAAIAYNYIIHYGESTNTVSEWEILFDGSKEELQVDRYFFQSFIDPKVTNVVSTGDIIQGICYNKLTYTVKVSETAINTSELSRFYEGSKLILFKKLNVRNMHLYIFKPIDDYPQYYTLLRQTTIENSICHIPLRVLLPQSVVMVLRQFNNIIDLVLKYGTESGVVSTPAHGRGHLSDAPSIVNRCLPLAYGIQAAHEIPELAPLINFIFGNVTDSRLLTFLKSIDETEGFVGSADNWLAAYLTGIKSAPLNVTDYSI